MGIWKLYVVRALPRFKLVDILIDNPNNMKKLGRVHIQRCRLSNYNLQ